MGYRIGIECDGKKFHNASRDEWRDAMILGGEHLDVIYRLRGSDINFYIEDAFGRQHMNMLKKLVAVE